MRVYTVPSDPAQTIGAQDIRIIGDEVAIVLSANDAIKLREVLANYVSTDTNNDHVQFATRLLYSKLKMVR